MRGGFQIEFLLQKLGASDKTSTSTFCMPSLQFLRNIRANYNAWQIQCSTEKLVDLLGSF